MPELSEIFGDKKLSYEEFEVRAAELGLTPGDLTAQRAEFEEKLKTVRRDHALERELDKAGVRNRALVSRVLDPERITVDEDGVHGIAEQIDALRQSDPYLFTGSAPAQSGQSAQPTEPAAPRRILSGMSHTAEPANPDTLSDEDYYRSVKKLPG